MPPPEPAPVRHDPDVLVIGGGVAGLFCAYHLRLRGATVAVAERGSVGGPESCSSGNTGFVGTQGAAPLAEPGVLTQGLRWLRDPESPFYIKPRLDAELASWLWHFRRACNAEDFKAGFGVLLDMKKRSMAILRELCLAGRRPEPSPRTAWWWRSGRRRASRRPAGPCRRRSRAACRCACLTRAS